MQLYVTAHTERGIDSPQVVKKKHQTGQETSIGYSTKNLSKLFPTKNDDRGNAMPL